MKFFLTVFTLRREVIWLSFLAKNLQESKIRPPNRNVSDTLLYKMPTKSPHVSECLRVIVKSYNNVLDKKQIPGMGYALVFL